MSPFIRIGWILLVFWAASPISASGQSADDFLNALGRVLRQIPDAGDHYEFTTRQKTYEIIVE